MHEAPPPPPVEREPYVRKDERPVHVRDLRGLRRWLLVAAVWATAATAIAVIALIAADDARQDNAEAGRRSARIATEVGDAQRRLSGRLDELEQRLDELPSTEDVSDLDERLRRLEGADGRAADRIEQLTESLDDLERRIESLERASANAGQQAETNP